MNPLAKELNETLQGSVAYDLLSETGKRFYFPKGIVAQSAEAGAKANRFNATIGMACSNKRPIMLDALKKHLPTLQPEESVSYAPTTGVKALREQWKKEILKKNSDLSENDLGLPVMVPGLTNGISQMADMFIGDDDAIIVPDMFWGNYTLIMEVKNKARMVSFPFFNKEGTLNSEALKKAILSEKKKGKAAIMLNFPNNPTGYSPTKDDAKRLIDVLNKTAEQGMKLLVMLDDAYFGLFYEDDIYKQSLYGAVSKLHKNILAVKIDGATKEDFVWGFRVGFVTFGGKGISVEQRDALNSKLMGFIRASISNSSHISQSIVLKTLGDDSYQKEKAEFAEVLKQRYLKVRAIVDNRTTGLKLKVLPFNSGYFMTFESETGKTEAIRLALLEKGIGTISIRDRYLRIAFSSVDLENMQELYDEVFLTADQILK